MPSHEIKIGKFYHADNGSREHHELSFEASEFPDSKLKGKVTAKLTLLRVEEGIMLLIDELNATEVAPCSHCAKILNLPLHAGNSEWLYYEEKPEEEDLDFEALFFDKHKMTMDVYEPIRQELILNENLLPRCKKNCVPAIEIGEPETEEVLKPLSILKDLIK